MQNRHPSVADLAHRGRAGRTDHWPVDCRHVAADERRRISPLADPAVVLSRLAALDPDRLTAMDRFEIVTIARLRPRTRSRPD